MFIKFHHRHSPLHRSGTSKFVQKLTLCISLTLVLLTTAAIHLSRANTINESPKSPPSIETSTPPSESATANTNDTWKISYFYHDHLGNITAVTDAHGNLLEVKDYLPFGGTNVDEHYSDSESDYSYNDKEKDDELNLYYYGARYYSASTGKFTSIDPAVLAIGTKEFETTAKQPLQDFLRDPQQLNSYSYAVNNPVNNKDSDGKSIQGYLFWKGVVLGLKLKGYSIAANSLNYSIATPVVSFFNNTKKPRFFGSSSDVSREIKKTKEYQDVLASIEKNIAEGRLEDYGSFKFTSSSENKDLFYTFGKVNYAYTAESIDGEKEKYEITIKITDTYNFDEIKNYAGNIIATAGNNLAYIDQMAGELIPYFITVRIDETVQIETKKNIDRENEL